MRKGLFLVIQEISQLWFEVFSAVGKYPFQYVSPSAIGCRFQLFIVGGSFNIKKFCGREKFFGFFQLLNQFKVQ